MRRALSAFLLAALAAFPAAAQGPSYVTVLSTDTLDLNGRVYRLHGVDGLEFHQFCFVDGRPWACGVAATRALQTLLDLEPVSCTAVGDAAGPEVWATCTMRLGDIAALMIERGWAVAIPEQTDRYVAAEAGARTTRAGAWRGVFVPPADFRADMAAIEERYVERAGDVMVRLAEAAVDDGHGGVTVFDGFRVARTATAAAQEVRIGFPETGFMYEAMPVGVDFTWAAVADHLQNWRVSVAGTVTGALKQAVWLELAARPQTLLEVTDAPQFLATVMERSAGWRAAGRQPILLVPAADNPPWIGEWLSTPPEGVVVTRKDISGGGYLGTIAGIDVYAGIVLANVVDETPAEAFLLPADLLIEIAYGPAEAGPFIGLTRDPVPDPDDLVFRYARSLSWRDDRVIQIVYPYQGPAPLYGD